MDEQTTIPKRALTSWQLVGLICFAMNAAFAIAHHNWSATAGWVVALMLSIPDKEL